MTRNEWVTAALAAADTQLGHVAVADDQVLDVIADALLSVEHQNDDDEAA
jgi:hypothetical protein